MNKAMSKKVICLVIIGTIIIPTVAFAKDNATKDETVYVTMYEDGKIKSEIVSDWLHSDSAINELKDKSSLTNIKNIKGKELPETNGDTLLWKTDKKDIFYQGNTTNQLPLDFKITYYLNDSEITPADLAGKSGKVKIKIEIQNKEKHSVTINGKERTIYTPMTVATIVNLPTDTFSNIKTNGAPIVSVGENKVISFVAFPGLMESLGIKEDDLGIDLPENLEITTDADNFKLGPILITVTPELPEVKELKAADNLDDLRNGLTDLKNATNSIQDGANKLNDGLSTARDGVNEATEELSKNNDKLSLVTNNDNVANERKIINDSFMAMNMDTSMLNIIPKYVTPQNMAMAQKALGDLKAANLTTIMEDPIFKLFPSLITPSNVETIGKLLQDTDDLSKVDMTKLNPMMSLLNNSTQLKGLMGQAGSLAQLDMSKLDPLKPLLSADSAAKLNSLMGNATSLAQLDMSTLDPLKPLLNTTTAAGLNNLMDQAALLSQLDTSKFAPLKPLLDPNNATELNSLLSNSTGLLNVDTNGMNAFLNSQISGADSFKTSSDLLNKPENIAALNQAIDIAYPADTKPQENAQLKGLIAGYEKLTSDTAANMEVSKQYITGAMEPSLNKLNDIKTQMNNDIPLLTSVRSALTAENINNANIILGQLIAMQNNLKNPQVAQLMTDVKSAMTTSNITNVNSLLTQLTIMQAGLKTPETTQLITTVQSALTTNNINNVNGMLGQLTIMQSNLKSPETTQLINGVQSALSDENVAYLKTVLPKLQSMQSDLASNAQNLQAVKALLAKASDPATVDSLAKIKVLEQDFETAKPVLTALQNEITPDTISKISASPTLVKQLTDMQNDLVTNKKILEIVQDSLSENNVDRANQLITALPTLTNGINDLADGSQALADGIKEFNTDGIMKLDSNAEPKLDEVKDVLSAKDELIKLSENYNSFTGLDENMNGTVKFVMRTDEIKAPDAKQTKKVVVKDEKKSFWQWIKSLF